MGFETKEIYHKQNKKQTNKQPLKTNKQTNKTHLPVSLYVVQGVGI